MLFLIVCGLEALPTDNDVHGSGLFNQLSKRSPQFTSREVANRLLSRLMDVAYDTFKDLGVGQEELREVHRKRSQITACYFQAVSCY
ncbi:Hypothetical predicted protein [Mytilus galloprovincialis]|nr:Hypothetical predicted protein [Mytilus galloprovincialis]